MTETNGGRMNKGRKLAVAGAIVVVLALGAAVASRGIGPRSKGGPGDPAAYATAKVARGDISASVAASGKLEPNLIMTIRPDSNMPTRKLVRVLVTQGQVVNEGQALAAIDPSGLDIDLKSAEANYAAQRAKLANLKAKPANLDISQSEADLEQARANLDAAREAYDGAKALVDKGLAAKSQLADAERQLSVATLRLEAARLSRENVGAQSPTDVIQAQEAALSQADSDLQRARLIFDSATIRSPVAGVVAELLVSAGDLVGPSTAIMTVVDPDPMILQAAVNENDMGQVKIGQSAVVIPSGYPDLQLNGVVTHIDLRAQAQGNVSVFQVSIELPNRDRRLLWGMNADAEISVLSLKDVLVLPTQAVKTSAGASRVNVLDGGEVLPWDVELGPSDGSRVQIVAGLDEGEEVVLPQTRAPSTSSGQQQTPQQRQPPRQNQLNNVMRALR